MSLCFNRQSGVTLMELMVAMTISLVVSLAMVSLMADMTQLTRRAIGTSYQGPICNKARANACAHSHVQEVALVST